MGLWWFKVIKKKSILIHFLLQWLAAASNFSYLLRSEKWRYQTDRLSLANTTRQFGTLRSSSVLWFCELIKPVKKRRWGRNQQRSEWWDQRRCLIWELKGICWSEGNGLSEWKSGWGGGKGGVGWNTPEELPSKLTLQFTLLYRSSSRRFYPNITLHSCPGSN